MRRTCARVLAAALMSAAVAGAMALPGLVGGSQDSQRALTAPASSSKRVIHVDVPVRSHEHVGKTGRTRLALANRPAALASSVVHRRSGPTARDATRRHDTPKAATRTRRPHKPRPVPPPTPVPAPAPAPAPAPSPVTAPTPKPGAGGAAPPSTSVPSRELASATPAPAPAPPPPPPPATGQPSPATPDAGTTGCDHGSSGGDRDRGDRNRGDDRGSSGWDRDNDRDGRWDGRGGRGRDE